QSTLLCVLSPGEVLESPGAVLEVARQGGGDRVASCRQWMADFLLLGR
ncbi:hypothetical protein A2U01_0105936, partial [Trifolium medium]|nr:hypothetical protein [Trifolium medium]